MIDARPETERLIPRKLREEDEEDLFRYASDPEIHNENAGRFAPRQTVEGFFLLGKFRSTWSENSGLNPSSS